MLLALAVVALVLVFGGPWFLQRMMPDKEFIRAAKSTLAEQDIKTAAALIELHKLRYGHYPATLHDLRFTGLQDDLALGRVRYICNPQGSASYIEPSDEDRPTVALPAEFWRGTGYSDALKPSTP